MSDDVVVMGERILKVILAQAKLAYASVIERSIFQKNLFLKSLKLLHLSQSFKKIPDLIV
jgi:hypothetical protein